MTHSIHIHSAERMNQMNKGFAYYVCVQMSFTINSPVRFICSIRLTACTSMVNKVNTQHISTTTTFTILLYCLVGKLCFFILWNVNPSELLARMSIPVQCSAI